MADKEKKGLIIKAISGFYYVFCDEDGCVYECRAKGAFRNESKAPLVGDVAWFEDLDDISQKGSKHGIVSKIGERKNEFKRPPMANLDKLFIVASVKDPFPSLLVIDKLITVCEYKSIEPIIVITKTDLNSPDELMQIYKQAGFHTVSLCNLKNEGTREIGELLRGCTAAFAGNTGVGKSSLLNNLCPSLSLLTADISKKLGRGKHTTRHVELFYINEFSCYVADTPGFGTMELMQYEIIRKEELQHCFREMAPFVDKCKFTGCSHTVEKGCAVLEAVENGEIQKKRHESYCELYQAARLLKEWEL